MCPRALLDLTTERRCAFPSRVVEAMHFLKVVEREIQEYEELRTDYQLVFDEEKPVCRETLFGGNLFVGNPVCQKPCLSETLFDGTNLL